MRIRTIKPEFWGDEKLAPMDPLTRLVFLGLISMADDAGRLLDSVKQIDGILFAHTDDTSRESLAKLAAAGRIRRGSTASGQRIIELVGWRHQKVDHPNLKAALPPIAQGVSESSRDNRDTVASDSREIRDSISTSDQRSTTDVSTTSDPTGARERAIYFPAVPALRSAEDPRQELASLLEMLPPEAIDVLSTFYEPAFTPASRERWRSVAMQMVDAVDPNHRGPKIRGGIRVKARSREHMADVCRAVLNDPPINRDAAIVFVLTKLTDPPKGPSVTEKAKREADAQTQREERYHAAMRAAGVKWSKEHPDEYAPILAAIDNQFRGKSGRFVQAARDAALAQKCAERAGFPSFDDWIRDNPSQAGAA